MFRPYVGAGINHEKHEGHENRNNIRTNLSCVSCFSWLNSFLLLVDQIGNSFGLGDELSSKALSVQEIIA